MVIFVIPTYNEAENITNLLNHTDEKMRKERLNYRVILVDDGSSDDTVELVQTLKDKIPIDVYSYYPNKGVGEAFRVGFRKALGICEDGDIIVTKEADNTSDLSILDKLISKINDGYDLALASCYAREGAVLGTTLFRLILSKGANALLKAFVPMKDIHTYSSFYRAYSSKALREMYRLYGDKLIEQSGFECMVELLIKFSRNGKFRITEVPMVLDGSRRAGKSKMRIFKTVKGFLKVIFKEGIIYRFKRDVQKLTSDGDSLG
jgi:dolichol-phosphate mannosyltransferase